MAHWKKVLLLVVILLSGYQPVKPDSKNIILMESDIPATAQDVASIATVPDANKNLGRLKAVETFLTAK